MRKQNTIKSALEFQGVGLHSGKSCKITLKPAPEDTGLVFVYKNGQTNQFVPYNPDHVTDTQNNISVSNGRAVVKTVEHLVAALYAFHVDNCLIEVTSSEIPIMDGSSKDFIDGLLKTGTVSQDKDREEFHIVNPIWVTLEDKYIVALPYNGLKLSYTISFPNSPIGTQAYTTEFSNQSFIQELSNARTFGFIEDLEKYQKNGLVLGGSYDNAQVYSRKENRALNHTRYDDEPVRHKVLDLIGALAILNFDMKAFIISFKGGHTLDVMFAKRVMSVLSGRKEIEKNRSYSADRSYYYHTADLLDLDSFPS